MDLTSETPLDVTQNIETSRRKQSKIMVVDDEPGARLMLRLMLEKASYRVVEAASAETLLNTVFEDDVDLVLLDVKMGGMNGIDACKALKRNVRRERHIPVIIVSGMDQRSTVLQAVCAGADDFILKPVTVRVLLDKVRGALEMSSKP